MKTYTTSQGDMWDGIAFKQYGTCKHMDTLMKANQSYIGVYIFPAGVVLNIPEIEEAASDKLPPWKKVSA